MVISNCVINLSPNKPQVWREIFRVLKPGGTVSISDLALLQPLPENIREMAAALVGCVAGAVLVDETKIMLEKTGFSSITLTPKPEYVKMMQEWNDPLYKEIAEVLPEGMTMADYVVSLSIAAQKQAVMNILFLCTGNSCRSIIAEALLKSMAPAGITAQSAGSNPTGFVHPRALAALQKAGIATNGFHSKSWDNLPLQPDIIITLCADAAGEACPVYLGKMAVRSHWGMPDPAKAQGDEATIEAAFADTVSVLHKRISALVLALEEKPPMGPEQLQKELDALAAL